MRRMGSVGFVCAALFVGADPDAEAAWHQPAGGESPINQADNRPADAPSLTAVGGVPYVAWSEFDGTNTEVRVSRLNQAGTAWEQVVGGPSPINEAANQSAFDPSLTTIGGVPYVAWREGDGTNSEIRVSRLNTAGTAWEEVVGGASPINHDATKDAVTPSLTAVGGVPYVAWSEDDGTKTQIRVSRLNQAGTAWDEVVGGASPINQASNQFALEPSLTAVGGVPYVAWHETDGTNFEMRVSRLNGAGTAWEQVVGGASPINQADNQSAGSASLTAIGGVPYIAWTETDGTNFEVRVSRLNAAGTAWEQAVGGPSPINHAANAGAVEPSLSAIGGVPYVAWREDDGTNNEVRVSRLNAAGTAWEEVVGGASPINQANNQTGESPSLTAIGGVPYVAWKETDGTNYETRVSRIEPELTAPQVLTTQTRAFLLTQVNSFGVPYPVAFEHGAGAGFGQRTATVSTTGGADTVFQTLEGLTAGTAYSARAVGSDGTRFYAPSGATQFTTAADPAPVTVPGQPPPAQVTRLLVAIVNPRLRARSGRRVTLSYLATAPGRATLEVLRGRRRIARIAKTARTGRNKIAWNGKQGRKKAKAGKYKLRLAVTGGDGQVAKDSATVTVKR